MGMLRWQREAVDGLCASAGAEAILVRHARLLELRCKVPCEHATNESPEGGRPKVKGGAMQQMGILLIVQEDAEMLVGGARRSSSRAVGKGRAQCSSHTSRVLPGSGA
ncbi:hypothetical protein AK812_SmicGene48708 [Symbiodinium microadriaticum]|uniref:Uncharacterized protein n=1 Tax=Symbiodinium microadriaticum TaxID=2951 RepID=A0A1Q8ZYQ6_SYMMI|nr:hypothetical protein AK812_SmicGene48708 [Symbiodinium microadriaticum]